MKKDIVVRFAPSPTGYLHVGGARTAIFNWLFARKHNGKFILRIEDTDTERSSEDLIQGIIDSLHWLGIEWQEGPNFQSQRIDEHVGAANKLITDGYAYKCFCTKDELDEKREVARKNKVTFQYDRKCRRLTADEIAEKERDDTPYTIRLKVPDEPGSVRFKDAVYGAVEKKYADIDDFVIVRSNGQPLYVLSNAVDDIHDGVTHVIRGQDGLANTPKQILLYRALNAPLPEFVHMSLALDPQKAKISKRKHGERVAVHYYEEKGFLSWALVNFLVLLGWSTPDSREIFSEEELIEVFSLEGISRNNPVFDIRTGDPKFFTDPKAMNINAHYIRSLPLPVLLPYIRPFLMDAGLWDEAFENEKKQWFEEIVDLIRKRFTFLTDFATYGRPFFSDNYPIDADVLEKSIINQPILKNVFPVIADRISGLTVYSRAELEKILREQIETFSIKPKILINGMRTALTGQKVGPEFFDILLALGQKTVVKRLKTAEGLFD